MVFGGKACMGPPFAVFWGGGAGIRGLQCLGGSEGGLQRRCMAIFKGRGWHSVVVGGLASRPPADILEGSLGPRS